MSEGVARRLRGPSPAFSFAGALMTLSVQALALLRELAKLPESMLSLPKAKLARKLNFKVRYFNKLLAKLIAYGVVERIQAPIWRSSTLIVKSDFVQNWRARRPSLIRDQTSLMQGPTAPALVGSQSIEFGSNTSHQNPLESFKALPPKTNNQNSGSENGVHRYALNRQLPLPDAKALKQLPCLKMTLFQLQVAARTGKLLDETREQLLKLRGTQYKAWWNAAVTGYAESFKQQHIARFQRQTGNKYHNTTQDDLLWKRCAVNVLELGVTIERYQDVAWDVKPKSMKWPTPRYIASDFVKDNILAWIPPEERQASKVTIDGEDLAVVMERSQKQIEAAAEANSQLPIPHREPMYFKRNWPGLYGKKAEPEDG